MARVFKDEDDEYETRKWEADVCPHGRHYCLDCGKATQVKNIWKYVISLDEIRNNRVIIPMPPTAKMLSVAVQFDELVVWEQHLQSMENRPKVRRELLVCPTGEAVDLPTDACFLNTVQLMEGRLVLHFFEVPIY